MPKLAVIPTHFTEASFIVRTLLLFLRSARLWLFRVSIDALCVHLVTNPVFFEKLTDRNPLLNVNVKVLAIVTL